MSLAFEVRAIGVGEYSRPGFAVPFAAHAEFDVSLIGLGEVISLGSVRVVFELKDLGGADWGQVHEVQLLPAGGSALLLGGAVRPDVMVRLLTFAVAYLEGSARVHRVPGSPVPEAVLHVG